MVPNSATMRRPEVLTRCVLLPCRPQNGEWQAQRNERMLDGFNESWIEFQDRGTKAIKGRIDADAVIASLVGSFA